MNESKVLRAKQVDRVWHLVRLAPLVAVLTILVAQPIPLAASLHLQNDNHGSTEKR